MSAAACEAKVFNPALGYAGTADIIGPGIEIPKHDLAFEPEGHVYTAAGRRVPGVTSILRRVGLIDDRWWTEHGRSRGTAVHAVIQYDLEGDLDEGSIAEEIRPYVEAFRKFRADYQPWTGMLIEVKTGASPPPWTALQLAAYALCLHGLVRRYVLNLRPDGSYRFRCHNSPRDIQTWLSVLAVYRWLNERGPKPTEETIGGDE